MQAAWQGVSSGGPRRSRWSLESPLFLERRARIHPQELGDWADVRPLNPGVVNPLERARIARNSGLAGHWLRLALGGAECWATAWIVPGTGSAYFTSKNLSLGTPQIGHLSGGSSPMTVLPHTGHTQMRAASKSFPPFWASSALV